MYYLKIIHTSSMKLNQNLTQLTASIIDTKIGSMIAIADENSLHFLEFFDKLHLKNEIEKLRIKKSAEIILGNNKIIESIKLELTSYFDGSLKEFKTPFHTDGSKFQILVWDKLMSVPYGETRTYACQANAIGHKKAYRAVANANGANQIAIVIPCHRIINTNGNLGGYSGGLTRKKWLINHEKINASI
jgi:AraC family transcriptional regulator of adaptative response/methylated-DNA-[protein]-cysteine methyltransferase